MLAPERRLLLQIPKLAFVNHVTHALACCACGRDLPAFPVACWYLYLHPGVVQVKLWIFAAQHAPMIMALVKVAVSVLCAVFTFLAAPCEASACVVEIPHAVIPMIDWYTTPLLCFVYLPLALH